MARPIHKLSARKAASESKPGLYSDGGGLYLQVSKSGSKSWIYRFMMNRKVRDMGLGSLRDFSLSEVRDKARECRQLVHDGIDPIEQRKSARSARMAENRKSQSFEDCANDYLKTHSSAWKNPKHRQQWENTLSTYVYPIIGKLSVKDINTHLVKKVLDPIWTTKTETATRVRGRIERILDWATVQELRQGENPARWKGHLDHLLPAPTKLKRVQHHKALPYQDMYDLMLELTTADGTSALGLRFLILTAARSGEVRLATWNEIDLEKKTWTIPAERMKAGKEHIVPLCSQAIDILKTMEKYRESDLIFSGTKKDRPLSDMAFTQLLRRLDKTDITAHGFRSSFRDWAGETTAFPREVIEAALAHQLKDKTEAAYFRSNLLEKRRKLMDAWDKHCRTISGKAMNIIKFDTAKL